MVLAAVLLCGIGAVVPTQPAEAYNLTGCKFSSATIPYLVSGLPSGYNLTAARDDWTYNTDVAGWATTTAAVRVDFRFNPYGALGWSGETDGPGVTCPGGGNHTATVQVRINRTYTDGWTANKRQGVMSHEIGHALGLHHNTTSSPCGSVTLMNPYDSQRYDTCSIYQTRTDDRNGANSLY